MSNLNFIIIKIVEYYFTMPSFKFSYYSINKSINFIISFTSYLDYNCQIQVYLSQEKFVE